MQYSYIFLFQSGALVNVYQDGSVLVSHGGTEMGQGLHTKMIQVASQVLYVQEIVTHLCSNLLYKMGHYLLDIQHECNIALIGLSIFCFD